MLYGRSGRVYYWNLEIGKEDREWWACNVTEVQLDPAACYRTIRIEKGQEHHRRDYVRRTAAGKRPRLRLAYELDEGVVVPETPFVAVESFIVIDGLEAFVDNPEKVTRQDTEFRCIEIQVRKLAPPTRAKVYPPLRCPHCREQGVYAGSHPCIHPVCETCGFEHSTRITCEEAGTS